MVGLFDATPSELHRVLISPYACIDSYQFYIYVWNYVLIYGAKLPGRIHRV